MHRVRHNGWGAERQWRFITALSVMGAVGPAARAARAVGMGRASAHRLREREGADGFAEAWDIAIAMGADTQFHVALDRAIHGVTTIRVLRGGSVDVTNASDLKLLNAAFSPGNRVFPLHKATRETR